MQKYILHEAISEGCFDRNYCSANGNLSPWAAELTNSPMVLEYLCQRMESDYEGLSAKMRKPYTMVSIDTRFVLISYSVKFLIEIVLFKFDQ